MQTKLARVPSTEPTQSLLARVLRRLPVSLKEPFSTLFVSLHGDGAGQSKLSAVPLATNAANAILLFSSTAESNNDALKQVPCRAVRRFTRAESDGVCPSRSARPSWNCYRLSSVKASSMRRFCWPRSLTLQGDLYRIARIPNLWPTLSLRGSPALLALMRTAEPQLGFHLLDWVERHPEQADLYSAALANAQQTIDADIAVCRATCPVHTRLRVWWR